MRATENQWGELPSTSAMIALVKRRAPQLETREREFIESLDEQWAEKAWISERQADWLRKLYNREA